jgi:hypothetical protein
MGTHPVEEREKHRMKKALGDALRRPGEVVRLFEFR